MNKIGIIIQREYTTRVMKKSFIIMTFLTPIFFILLILLPGWLATLQDESQKHIIVIDRTGLYQNALKSNEIYNFEFTRKSIDELRNTSKEKSEFTALLLISENLSENPKAATLYYEKQIGMELSTYIAGELNKYIEEQNLAALNIANIKQLIDSSKSNVNITGIKWSAEGEEKAASAELAFAIGMVLAMMIYMFIIMYGTQVMTGVVQEKTSRIVEVIISSVRPFDLMMGKIIGIALVGLTQFAMWLLLTGFGLTLVQGLFGVATTNNPASEMALMQGMENMNMADAEHFMDLFMSFNWFQTIVLFIIFFLGGYLLYASFFAAIGSAVDNETDANQFTFPIMLPIILAVFAAIYAVRNPESTASFWFSIIPFTSPVVMMVRLPFDVPTWQIIMSIGILIASFIGSTWLAAKIYRTGILMYGKKITWKELWKWLKNS